MGGGLAIARASEWMSFWVRARVLGMFLFFLCLGSQGHSEVERKDIAPEDRLKAVFLFKFTQFTEWPQEAFADPGSPFVIGILGSSPFGTFLDETVHNEQVHGRKIVVERFLTVAESQKCHILYIGSSETDRLGRVLEAIRSRPILTVSDIETAGQNSVMIRFVTKQNKIRFRINADAAREAKLTLSSKLLRAADVVIDRDRK